jgi:hypothetical protein
MNKFVYYLKENKGLEERLRAQNNNANKSLTTRVTVKPNKYTFKDEKIKSHTDKNGICYQIGGNLLNKNILKI